MEETLLLQPSLTAQANEEEDCIDIYLPRILDSWPWLRRVNPHYTSVEKQASSWFEAFKAFSPKAQNAFNKGNFTLLAALAYPDLDKVGYRIGCDLMNLFFCIDEYTDLATPDVARSQANIIMDAFLHPHKPRPSDECIMGEITRQFWANTLLIASPIAQTRFVERFRTYLDAVIQQAEDRAKNHVRNMEDYFQVRRETIGALPAFSGGEWYWNIPQEVIDHPVLAKLTEICVDLMVIANDIYSYKVEWERGDEGHNLVTVVIQQFSMSIQDAMDYIGRLNDRLIVDFFEQWSRIPVFDGPVDKEVRAYCNMMGNWVRGNDSWCFEGERYFGKKGPEIETSRLVQLSRTRREASCSGKLGRESAISTSKE